MSWNELQHKYREAVSYNKKLILAYKSPKNTKPKNIWRQLIGIAKYLSRTGNTVSKEQIKTKLNISDRVLELGLQALTKIGFVYNQQENSYKFVWQETMTEKDSNIVIDEFLDAIAEEQFQKEYFATIPTNIIDNFCHAINW